jgi:alpha-mannosidase
MICVLKPGLRLAALFLLTIVALFVAEPVAAAQGSTEFTRAAATLPPDASAVANRLMSLRELPNVAWKYHTGDLAHGEDPNLDDSAWPIIPVGTMATNDAVWFRQTITVPRTLNGYDLAGVRIWFQFHAEGNGPVPQILYLNGRRMGMGEDLEPVVLFDNAQPGDKAVVAVELLHSVDTKRFRGATMRIDFLKSRPNPADLAEEFLSAAELIPSLSAGDATPMATLYAAINKVDLDALNASDSAKFDVSLKAAQAQFEALRPLLQRATFHLDGNSHIDAAWLWPWSESVGVVKNTYSTALQLMNEYPGYKFTQSAAAYNEWVVQDYPDVNDRIKQRITEGRWEIVGGMWVEPDLNMPDGESLVRQLLVGKRWYRKAYGVDVRIGWNPDSFGYSWQLPQIYKKSGIDYFVTQKLAWNDTNKLPFKLFWWQSPDGSKVLTYFSHDYGNQSLNPVRLSEDLKTARSFSPGLPELLDLYGISDHGGGPTRVTLDEGLHWMDPGPTTASSNGGAPVTPKYEFGTAQAFFSTVEKEIAPQSRTWNYQSIGKGYEPPTPIAGKIAIPTWDSELYLEYHRGVFTTQAHHKHNMRVAEEEMLNAEKWSSLAWLNGKNYPSDELTEDWKKVLFNQFHDLAAGSGIAAIYKDAQKDYDWVRMSTDEISAHALTAVAEHVNTKGDGIPVLIYNPLGWERSGDVTVRVQLPGAGPTGLLIFDPSAKTQMSRPLLSTLDEKTGIAELSLHVSDIPALGYKLIRIVPSTSRSIRGSVKVGSSDTFAISGKGIHVEVNKKTGCITSLQLTNSQGGTDYEMLAPGSCGNELQTFKDTPTTYDAWNIDPGALDVPPTVLNKADSVELLGEDTLTPRIRVTRTWQNSKFAQTISIPHDTGIVDIGTDIEWNETHVLLKAAFPLAVTNNFATYEIPYGTIERPTTRDNSWDKAQFEVPALRWADLTGAGPDGKVHGLSVLNQDKYGYDAVGNVLRLSLLRSPIWPDAGADRGRQQFHYALYPHAGTWKDALTMRRGWEYDYPLQAVVTTSHSGSLPAQHSFASVGPDNVILTAVKKAEDANALIFRAYEWAGKETTAEFHVPRGATSATITNLMEQPEGAPLAISGETVKVTIHPYEIVTVRVDYARGGAKQE